MAREVDRPRRHRRDRREVGAWVGVRRHDDARTGSPRQTVQPVGHRLGDDRRPLDHDRHLVRLVRRVVVVPEQQDALCPEDQRRARPSSTERGRDLTPPTPATATGDLAGEAVVPAGASPTATVTRRRARPTPRARAPPRSRPDIPAGDELAGAVGVRRQRQQAVGGRSGDRSRLERDDVAEGRHLHEQEQHEDRDAQPSRGRAAARRPPARSRRRQQRDDARRPPSRPGRRWSTTSGEQDGHRLGEGQTEDRERTATPRCVARRLAPARAAVHRSR